MGATCSCNTSRCCNERSPTSSRCREGGLSGNFIDVEAIGGTQEAGSYSSTHHIDCQDDDDCKSGALAADSGDLTDPASEDDKSPRQPGIWSFNSPPHRTAAAVVSAQHDAARKTEPRRLGEKSLALPNEAVRSETTTGVEPKAAALSYKNSVDRSRSRLSDVTDATPTPSRVGSNGSSPRPPGWTSENTDSQKGDSYTSEQQMKQKKKWRISFRSPSQFMSSQSQSSTRDSVMSDFGGMSSVDEDGEKKEKKKRGLVRSLTRKLTKKSVRKGPVAPDGRKRITTSNANVPASYTWLEAPLRSVAINKASTLGCVDAQTQKAFTPLFFVVGGCPNYFCGMQAIAYFVSTNGDGEVDFWWVKPSKSSGTEMEHATLSRHGKGPHKNDPGRSKPFYQPLADMFAKAATAPDGRRYSIEVPPGENSSRALIEEDSLSGPKSSGKRDKLWLHLVWQEDWTTNPFSSSKYIKGRLIYQRDPKELIFYAREYMFKDGVMTFSDFEDRPYSSLLPGESIKELYEPTT